MTPYLTLVSLLMAAWLQGSAIPQNSEDVLTPAEKTQLEREEKIENRIKVYEAASARLHLAIRNASASNNFSQVPGLLKSYLELLTMSFKDIDGKVARNKKSKGLIRYEIQLRKSIADMENYKLKAPVEQQADFEEWVGRAEEVHKKFVDILFQR